MEIIFARARPTFSSFTFMYIHPHAYTYTFAIFNKREKFVPGAKRTSIPRRNGSFTKKRKTNIFRMQHPATIYIYFSFTLALFQRYSTFTADIRIPFENRAHPMVGRTREISERNKRFGSFLRKEIFVRKDELQVGSKVSDRDEINFLPFGNVSMFHVSSEIV